MMNKAEQVNSSLYLSNGNHITSLVDSYYIVGTNINDTLTGLTYYNSYGNYGMTKTTSSYGDGTVPAWSGDLGGMYPNKTYYAPGKIHGAQRDNNGNFTGIGLLDSGNVFNMIKNIINNDPNSLPSNITQNKPYN